MRGATPPLPSMSPWRTQGQVYFTDAPRITKYFRKARHKYESRIHMVNYIRIYKGIQLKFKLQHTRKRSAAA